MCYDHVTNHLTKSRINELMKRQNVGFEEVARRIQATPEMLQAIEDGRYDPPLSVAHKLAAALHVPVEKLFHDQDGRIHNC
jgi:DNA-binding XRE family transcriptional regulator